MDTDFGNEIELLLLNSVSNNTLKVYKQGLEIFNQFRLNFRHSQTWPVPLNQIVDFVAYLYKCGYAYSTVNCYISGLSHFSRIENQTDNTQAFIVRKLMEGIKRINPTQKDSRLPITRELLLRILSVLPVVCKSKFESTLFRAAFLLCFHGMFRVGELTAISKSVGGQAVSFRDVIINQQGLEITLRHSKTDRYGAGVNISISGQTRVDLCPVKAITSFLNIRPKADLDGPLFLHFDLSPLTRGQFSSVLKRTLEVLGISNKNYMPHSFRIGKATQCAIDGLPDDQIKQLGRWKSSAYLRYIRIPL